MDNSHPTLDTSFALAQLAYSLCRTKGTRADDDSVSLSSITPMTSNNDVRVVSATEVVGDNVDADADTVIRGGKSLAAATLSEDTPGDDSVDGTQRRNNDADGTPVSVSVAGNGVAAGAAARAEEIVGTMEDRGSNVTLDV